MTERIPVSALVESATKDVKLNRLAMFGRVVEVAEVSPIEWYTTFSQRRRLMELSLTHKLSEIGITIQNSWSKAPSMEYKDIIAIKLLVAPLEKGESETNVTPEFMETIYGTLKEPWRI